MKGDDHSDAILEIYTVAAFAADQLKTGFKKEFFRLGGGDAELLRQRTPQGLR